MQVVPPELIQDKKVLLRLDIDVPLKKEPNEPEESKEPKVVVVEDFRLRAGLPTLKLCLEHAAEVIVMGHVGRPEGKEVSELSVEPIFDWFQGELGDSEGLGKLKILENLRFEKGEDACDLEYAKELAALGGPACRQAGVFVNEAFAAHHKAASTTVLPTLLPHAAGLNFAKEVEILTKVRENPGRPLVVIIGGVKVEDKLPAVLAMAGIADYVLVGGKIAGELSDDRRSKMEDGNLKIEDGRMDKIVNHQPSTLKNLSSIFYHLPSNILVAELNKDGTDITPETIDRWQEIISQAGMVVWNGPVGKIEEPEGTNEPKEPKENTFGPFGPSGPYGSIGSQRGTYELAHILADSDAEVIVGGGDTVGYLEKLGFLDKFSFFSTGGGAMLEFLEKGTLPTIEALE